MIQTSAEFGGAIHNSENVRLTLSRNTKFNRGAAKSDRAILNGKETAITVNQSDPILELEPDPKYQENNFGILFSNCLSTGAPGKSSGAFMTASAGHDAAKTGAPGKSSGAFMAPPPAVGGGAILNYKESVSLENAAFSGNTSYFPYPESRKLPCPNPLDEAAHSSIWREM